MYKPDFEIVLILKIGQELPGLLPFGLSGLQEEGKERGW